MKAEMFDKIVKARTDELVDNKIRRFMKTVIEAARLLLGPSWSTVDVKRVINIASGIDSDRKWPKELWEHESKEVAEALLKTFDEFTQAKLAADKAEPPENKMEEEKKPEPAAVNGDDDSPF